MIMNAKDILKRQTPSQTIGPFFAYGLTPSQYGYDFPSLVTGQMVDIKEVLAYIQIKGTIYDGEGVSIEDAMIELWQNDGEQQLFGRYGTGTEDGNSFTFTTVKPKGVNGEAPYINVILFMRGQLLHSYTRIYFSDEAELNKTDKVFNSIPKDRRKTLIAKKKGTSYVFDIHMQGDNETVFFKV
jgi:protocatechuate 3,4-dioxygenase alpha subunit